MSETNETTFFISCNDNDREKCKLGIDTVRKKHRNNVTVHVTQPFQNAEKIVQAVSGAWSNFSLGKADFIVEFKPDGKVSTEHIKSDLAKFLPHVASIKAV